ncbi:MAG: hypothetical protein HND47_08695 [Chloroflexi bacterium]|nr:hypothetical protein [Chloroflexota bacterium]
MRAAPEYREHTPGWLFGLSDKDAKAVVQARAFIGIALWVILTGVTFLLTSINLEDIRHKSIVGVLSLIKYAPLFYAAYALAKAKSAHYLGDIFELDDQAMAEQFIENVAFGGDEQTITIDEGKVSEKDERSPIILIGGPGKIKVNLGSAALLERVNGEPEVVYARSEPWKVERFERIREIGKNDEVGKREYAAINLRDQFVSGLPVKSRTKDGIPIEANEIKIIFSILRKKGAKEDSAESDPYSFESGAVESLVYKHTIITPPPKTVSGVAFPWDTTIIPLVIYELEKLITSSTLSEILASISQKEMEALSKNEETITQKRVEITGVQPSPGRNQNDKPPAFISRSKITAKFYSPEFREKAAKLGVALHWIDIGTGSLPDTVIIENLKQAWTLARENARRAASIERGRKKHELEFFVELINVVVIGSFDRPSSSVRLTEREIDELAKAIEKSQEVIAPTNLRKQLSHQGSRRDAHTIAVEMLKAFRRELIAAKELILKEDLPQIEKEADVARINNAINHINIALSLPPAHYVKRGQ